MCFTHSKYNPAMYVCMLAYAHSRNPEERPAFREISDNLSSDESALLAWIEEDQHVSPQAAVLGAPLEEGMNLYLDLQNTYY